MRRLPIRLRVTLVFAAAMALVLLGVGALIYARFESDLDDELNRSLQSRGQDVATLLRESDTSNEALDSRSIGFAQILSSRGPVLDSTEPTLPAVLGAEELRRASRGPIFASREGLPGIEEGARMYAIPVKAHRIPSVVVVAASTENRDDSLDSLRTILLLAGPAALLLASLAGYVAVGAALRPVEAMRRRAAEISGADPAQRLPVSPARDELRALAETLNEMLTRLEETLERERAFVDDASHELRTPLAMQRSELELALRHASSEDELRAAIASSIEEVDRIAGLAEGLLVLARSDKGRLTVKPERVDAGELLTGARARFEERAGALGRTVETGQANGIAVNADRASVEQALANLVDNALRYGEGPVKLSARRGERGVELHVRDRGPGFAQDFLPRAFERFSRADEARSGGGTGLGLAIVEAIAEAHGGRAAAANADGGADVWIELPAA
jgi:heavy metal sensor kinase